MISLMLACSQRAVAQSLPGSDTPSASSSASDTEVEELYDKDEAKPAAKAKPENHADKKSAEVNAIPEAQNLSDLAKLAPFSDIAVIQKRFLPKTKRFEASAVGFTNLNNPFFTSYGVGLRLGYYLTEKWAIEGIADLASTGSRQVTDDLNKNLNITTASVVTSKGFFGGAIKWNPIYGKITWLNQSIVPFDINFSLGGGMTQTTENRSEPTLHLSTSQVFAYTKAMAFRWDLTWNMYQATAKDNDGNAIKLSQSDLFLGVGVSFYFPEASYR